MVQRWERRQFSGLLLVSCPWLWSPIGWFWYLLSPPSFLAQCFYLHIEDLLHQNPSRINSEKKQYPFPKLDECKADRLLDKFLDVRISSYRSMIVQAALFWSFFHEILNIPSSSSSMLIVDSNSYRAM